jgi:ParB/RepB/Spo0J family partition protein
MTDENTDPGKNAAQEPATDQPLLFDLPSDPLREVAAIASSQPKPRTKRRADRPAKLAPTDGDLGNAVGAEPAGGDAQIVFINPFLIEPEPFNGRGLAVFDPQQNRELIEDMRARGNTVPVRLRPKADDAGFTCPSGSRRVNAARVIAADDPEFRVAAIVDVAMTDAQAYALCLSDNYGRSEVTPLQRGREMKWAIEHLHGGSRQSYIDEHGINPSVVSRALDLVELPETILQRAVDRERLPTLFAEKLAPRMKDKAGRKAILARANALGDKRLPAPRLLHYLLTGENDATKPDNRTMVFGEGRNKVIARATVAADMSATVRIPAIGRLTDEQQRDLKKFVLKQVTELLMAADR